jgi:hypothetical protein
MSKSKNKKKSSQMVLRVEKHEKDQFQDICKDLDTSAARELRRFLREFVAAHSPAPATEPEAPLPVQAEAEPVEAAAAAPAEAAVEAPAEATDADSAEAKGRKRAKKK